MALNKLQIGLLSLAGIGVVTVIIMVVKGSKKGSPADKQAAAASADKIIKQTAPIAATETTASGKQPSDGFPLKIGSRGWGVAMVQASTNRGVNQSLDVDGKLGNLTRDAMYTENGYLPMNEGDFKNYVQKCWTNSGMTKDNFIAAVNKDIMPLDSTYIVGGNNGINSFIDSFTKGVYGL